MKKNLSAAAALFLSAVVYSQVGINNTSPKATLDITAKSTNGTTAEGIIPPRLTGDQVKSSDGNYGADQKGAIVYATAAVSSSSTKTANITTEGYYYFDGSVWRRLNTYTAGNGLSITGNTIVLGGNLSQSTVLTNNGNPFQITGSASTTTFTTSGNVGLGTSSPGAKLEINNGNSAGAIKIVDGTQAVNKVLTSDNNGTATWQYPTSTPSYFGTWDTSYSGKNISYPKGSEVYTGLSITLPPGKYFVFVSLGYSYETTSWRYASYSTSASSGSTDIKFLGGGGYSFAGNADIANPTWLIDLNSATGNTTIYFKQSDNNSNSKAGCCGDQFSVTAFRL